MNNYIKVFLATSALASVACGPPPKVLVGHNFAGPDKSVKVMIQDSGNKNKASGTAVYNVIVRMCDVSASGEAGCKDSQVLDNVVPGSVY